MRKGSLSAMAVVAISIGLAGFMGTGCGLSTNGGVVDPTEPPDSTGGPGKTLVVPNDGSEVPGVGIAESPTAS